MSARAPANGTLAADARLTLPVSGLAARLRKPTGREDVLLAEARLDDPAVVVALLDRLVRIDDWTDGDAAWETLPVFDVDTLILWLRRLVMGDRLTSTLACQGPDCGSRIEISFGIADYLGHHTPHRGALRRRGWRVGEADADLHEGDLHEGGWREIVDANGAGAHFRLPTLGDQLAVFGLDDPASALAMRCLPADGAGAKTKAKDKTKARAEAAMAVLAPPLAGALQGRCPDCGAEITAWFEARAYCLRELSLHARYVYDDVDTLAERYHWSERAILALPGTRRALYAERARQGA
jgi:hypothetical protein